MRDNRNSTRTVRLAPAKFSVFIVLKLGRINGTGPGITKHPCLRHPLGILCAKVFWERRVCFVNWEEFTLRIGRICKQSLPQKSYCSERVYDASAWLRACTLSCNVRSSKAIDSTFVATALGTFRLLFTIRYIARSG